MKRILLLLLFVSSLGFSQSSGITYQAVIYNPNGEELPGIDNPYAPLTNQDVCLQFGIVDADGNVEYQEEVQVTTDAFGMVNLLIGTNTQTGGYAADFAGIEWSADAKFLKVDLDIKGNCTDFEELSYQPFTYVPFAYYSPASDVPGPEGPAGPAGADGQDGAEGLQGPTGPAGPSGLAGNSGNDGQDGLSSYGIWLDLGNTGTQEDFIDSLTGPEGPQGAQGAVGPQGPPGSNDGENSTGNGYIEYTQMNIAQLKLSSDGQNIIIHKYDYIESTNSIKVYSLFNNVLSQKGQVLDNYTNILGINTDGSRIVVSDFSTPEIDVFDLVNNSWVLNATIVSNQAYYGKLSDDGNTLITVTNASGSVKHFSFDTTALQWELLFDESIFNTGRYDFTSNLQYFTTSFPIDGTNYNGSVKVYKNNLNSVEQIGQTIYGNDDLDFLGDHSSLSESGNVVAVTLRSNKVKVYEKISANWIEKGNTIDLFARPDKAFISPDGDELIVLVNNIFSYPMSIIRFIYQNNSWNQKGSVTLTNNTSSTSIPSDYESGTIAIRNRTDTEPNTTSDSFPDIDTLLIKFFE